MHQRKHINQQRLRRAKRVRSTIRGTAERPRLSVFRSNAFTYVQLIDDAAGKTLVASSTRALAAKGKKSEAATALGKAIAAAAKKAGIARAVLDRGSYRYHGRVKAVAEAARKAGLKI